MPYINGTYTIKTQAEFNEAVESGKDLTRMEQQRLDLSYWNFLQKPYKFIDLSKTVFYECILFKTNFSGVCLFEADFQDSDCRETIFIKTNLSYAYFSFANLQKANVCGAKLVGVRFGGADLRNLIYDNTTDFRGATYNRKTLFDDDFILKEKGMILK